MTDINGKPTQGNICTAIKALQQGARVFRGEDELVLRDTGWFVWQATGTNYHAESVDVEDTAFTIEWPKPRTPKRGEVWGGEKPTYIVLAVDVETLILRELACEGFEIMEKCFLLPNFRYYRDATPEEMAQFDGGWE